MGCWPLSCGHDVGVRLKELYGGAARRSSLTVAGVSAVGGALTGVVVGTTALAGAPGGVDQPPGPSQSPQPKHVRQHSPSPAPYFTGSTSAVTPSHSVSASTSPSATPTS